VETNHISYNLNAAGEIELRVVLMGCASSHKTTETEMIETVTEKNVSEEKTPSIVLYFVQKNDTLWDIAKRYHTSPMSIAAQNSLTESVFASHDSSLLSLGVRKIIIR
jgi:LysM repeat protein